MFKILLSVLFLGLPQVSFAATEDQKAACYRDTLEIAAHKITSPHYKKYRDGRIAANVVTQVLKLEKERSYTTPSSVQIVYKDFSSISDFVKSPQSSFRDLMSWERAGQSWFRKSLLNMNEDTLKRIFYTQSCEGVLY